MAKFQSPLLGYNNNVRHKNRVFHIQTEDSGVGHPHIITHLFMDGGRILKSVKTSYAEHVGTEGMKETVRGMMKEQHKAMFIALRDGQYDHIVDPGAAAAAAAAAAAPAAAAPAAAPKPSAAPPAAATPSAAPPAAATPSAAPPAKEADVSASDPALAAVTAPEGVAAAPVPSSAPSTNPDPPRIDVDAAPNTIDDAKRPVPPPASASPKAAPVEAEAAPAPAAMQPAPRSETTGDGPRIVLAEADPEDVPMTTRQPAEARPDAIAASAARKASATSALNAAIPPAVPPVSPSGRELTLDFDALDRVAQEASAPSASLFNSADLPPPPKNMFASKEAGSGGVYRAVEADGRHDPREEAVAPEEAGGRNDPREEPAVRGTGSGTGRAQPAVRREESPQPARAVPRTNPALRPASDARYAPARPAAIFGNTQRPQPQSLFSDELVSDKSLDEVILSYLAEDLEPPRRK
jgi:hypothetical protein